MNAPYEREFKNYNIKMLPCMHAWFHLLSKSLFTRYHLTDAIFVRFNSEFPTVKTAGKIVIFKNPIPIP